MKISVAWIRSLLPGLDATAQDIAERLTRSGLEVEEIVTYGAASKHVIVAEVVEVAPHPERDKLTLVTVDRGDGRQVVVCGAPNVPPPGGRVALAPIGTVLPAMRAPDGSYGLRLEAREIAGILSEGMLCSEVELGLVDGAGKGDGIMILSGNTSPLGTPLAEAIPATYDTILEIGVTPNRPDALGHIGVARDVAALFELPFSPPEADAPAKIAGGKSVGDFASVSIEDPERCPHYGAAVVTDVVIGPSPDWLRYRLESLGIRAISNVVDVTNLVLLEFGHPMHAFDLELLPEGRIVVRRAADGEKMTTLDGVERTLVADDLLITDGERGVALAGVMGGESTEIRDTTTRVLLECAYFAPRGIRRTSRRHGLHSESSHRFERGVDPEAVPDVLAHAASLLTRLCGGSAVPGSIMAGVAPAPRRQIRLRHAKMTALLGLDLSLERASSILDRLGCEVARRADELAVTTPSFRPDLQREEDLIEEVMRIHGIDTIPTTHRALVPAVGRSTPTMEDRVRNVAADLGLSEALTYGFVAPRELEALGAPPSPVQIKNPLTEDRSVMRTSLLVGLLEALRRARRHGVSDVRLFTTGRLFVADGDLPDERVSFAAVLAGTRSQGLERPVELDVYDAKGVALELVERVTKRAGSLERLDTSAAPHLHPRGAGRILIDGREVGRLGPLHPDVIDAFDLDGSALVIEIDVASLEQIGRIVPQFRPIPVLPAVTRDLNFVVSDDVVAAEVANTLRRAAGELCESVELFDLYRGKGVADAHQSLAFHLVFRDPKAATHPDEARTLTDEEVDRITKAVVSAAARELGATIRA